MSSHICLSVEKNCYATMWSYGEICVGCNCCGRQETGLKMWEARLNYHKEELDRNINFNSYDDDYPELIEIQKLNQKENIKYEKAKIRYCEKNIKRLSNCA
jgi:hypothetical protein